MQALDIFHRHKHILVKKLRTASLGSLLFFDCETKPDPKTKSRIISDQRLWFGYAYAFRLEDNKISREKWEYFETPKQFWNFLRSRCDKKRPLYCFAHNLPFDLTQVDFWKFSESENFDIEYFVAEDPPSIFKCRWDGMKITFIDTLNYWRASLKDLGASIGLEKGEISLTEKSKKKWETYCKRDVEIISRAIHSLLQFIETHDLGAIAYSAPSLAMNAYRRRFMKHEIFIHDNKKMCSLERAAYYGGRVQCFRLGKINDSPIYNLDVNSLYPAVMRFSFPSKYVRYFKDISPKEAIRYLRGFGGVALCYLNSSGNSFPKRYNERLCFVSGKFHTALCGPELEYALESNSIKHIHYLSIYELKPIFTEYVNFFYKLRLSYSDKSEKVMNQFCKLMLNSLYGKFGQNGNQWVELTKESLGEYLRLNGRKDLLTTYEEWTLLQEFEHHSKWKIDGVKEIVNLRRISNQIQLRFPIMEHFESFPAIAGFVTSYAREYLRHLIEVAGEENTFYCDTDSLFVNSSGYKRLELANWINPTELGKLKLEKTFSHMEIFGPKDYVADDKKVRKGIRHNAVEISPGVFEQVRFEGLKSILRRGGENYVRVETITKTNKREFNKGKVTKQGLVIPYHLNESFESVKDQFPMLF